MWALLSAAATGALAAPSPLCPGACASDAAAACGGPEDCSGGACLFEDECLPGGADAVVRVVPPAEVPGLDDFEVWPYYGIPGITITADTLEMGVPLDWSAYPMIFEFPVSPGKKYALRARVEQEDGASGYFEVLLPVAGTATFADSATEAAPAVQAAAFASGLDTTAIVFLTGSDSGNGAVVRYDELALLELDDALSSWVRFAVDAPLADVTVSAPYSILFGGPVFYASMPEAVAPAGGGWSPWIDLADLGAASLTAALTFTDAAGGPITSVEGRVQLAWAPRDEAVVFDRSFATDTGHVGLWAPSANPNPLHLADRVSLTSDLVARDVAAWNAQPGWSPARQPESFGVVTIGGWDGLWGPWSAQDGFTDLFRDLGMNGVYQLTYPDAQEDHLSASGLEWRYTGAYPPFEFLYPNAAYDLDALDAALPASWEAAPAAQAGVERTQGDPDRLLLELGDEIGGLYLTGPQYDAAFRDWLRTEVLACADPTDPVTCTPESFGFTDWTQVHALDGLGSGMNAAYLDGLRPDPADPVRAAFFVQQLRFWNVATAEVYGHTRAAYAARAPGARISANLGTPIASYMGWRFGTELQTMLRAGALDAFHGEGFLMWNDWCLGQWLATEADWLDGQLSPWDMDRRSLHLHANRGDARHKTLTLAARGIDLFDWYMYGPNQLTTGDGVGGFGEGSVDLLQHMADGNTALAIAEPALAGAQRRTGGVAMLATQSDPVWWSAATDVSAHTSPLSNDEVGLHLALTHGHHPVRFLVEERLPTDLLDDTEVLFVARRYVDDASFAAIRAWVEAGGTLVTSGELPVGDAFGQTKADRVAWLGQDAAPVDPTPGIYTVQWSGIGQIVATAPRRRLDPAAGTVLATYGDGSAAVVERVVGAGRVRMIGFELGADYLSLDPYCGNMILPGPLGSYPTGYDEVTRAAVLDGVEGVARPAWADAPLVEVIRVDREDGGGALVLLDYGDDPVVTVTVPGAPAEATALFSGARVALSADGVATLDLDGVEVLTWEAPDAPPTTATGGITDSGADAPPDAPALEPGGRCGCGSGPSGTGGLGVGVLLWALRRAAFRDPRARTS